MLVVATIKELQNALHKHRQANKKIAVVPTMGNLHEGHLALVKTAQQHADIVVVTLFVNPTQFGANEDLDSYPRTFQDDCDKLDALNTSILFAPNIDEMYPLGGDQTTHVHVPNMTQVLCGASRPGHFDGVTTIVSKLFNITRADIAIFGEKDYQQLAVIRRMVNDLNIPIKIIGKPIVREPDGLAMSSRNGYLSEKERRIAPRLHQLLQTIKQEIIEGNHDLKSLESHAITDLIEAGFKPDYLQIYQRSELRPATENDKEIIILAAAFLGSTRLIDNIYVNRS
ncbi:pantoate--beta-alanine ligase [Cycloclasticus pugetii]|jgi:pantoate--beta-alanine ligase|uniref:pantoate--beta-alanine ligase n=1 Tax=Cycloclasticus pugetii TaxID=34068 RepID=UPI000922A539|nr:pantoate--beta-alanine ligase [Cycloclasticus pugetii]SHJ52358.1 pantothenate synthetase [Cycloclasticus pugetii]|tara:strand:+ start:83 stop:934 length:852 start_codon:yes stop_codon:yes gene_type:complete